MAIDGIDLLELLFAWLATIYIYSDKLGIMIPLLITVFVWKGAKAWASKEVA